MTSAYLSVHLHEVVQQTATMRATTDGVEIYPTCFLDRLWTRRWAFILLVLFNLPVIYFVFFATDSYCRAFCHIIVPCLSFNDATCF